VARYAAFLRGMNLGGRRIANAELGEAIAALGYTDVRTFRASGNVAFEADPQPERELQQRIEEGLAAALGYPVPTFLRAAEEVLRIAAHAPFEAALEDASAGKLQVSMLGALLGPNTMRTKGTVEGLAAKHFAG
jgi:uncharacterized protein (DUF1697 family)